MVYYRFALKASATLPSKRAEQDIIAPQTPMTETLLSHTTTPSTGILRFPNSERSHKSQYLAPSLFLLSLTGADLLTRSHQCLASGIAGDSVWVSGVRNSTSGAPPAETRKEQLSFVQVSSSTSHRFCGALFRRLSGCRSCPWT